MIKTLNPIKMIMVAFKEGISPRTKKITEAPLMPHLEQTSKIF
jgi:hypothetical protein